MYIEFVSDFSWLSKFVLRLYDLQLICILCIGFGACRKLFFRGEMAILDMSSFYMRFGACRRRFFP